MDMVRCVNVSYEHIKPIYVVYSNGKVYSKHKKGFLNMTRNNKGYLYVSLMGTDNIPYKINVHVIVANHFIGECPDGMIIDHLDGNKSNNDCTNLEYVTYQENYWRARDNNLIPLGDELSYATLTNDEVITVCEMLQAGAGYDMIIDKLSHINNTNGRFKAIIISIKTRKKWKHISRHYEWSSRNKNSIYDDDFIHEVCRLISLGKGPKEIGELMDVKNYNRIKRLVRYIKYEKGHRKISKEYGI